MRTSLSSLFLGHSSVIEGLKGGRGGGEDDDSQILGFVLLYTIIILLTYHSS